MSRRVDEIQLVGLAVSRRVRERGGLRLDRDAALALDVHRIEHLGLHLAIGQAAATLDDPVGQRALAVVDVGDDGEVSDVIHEGRSSGRARGAGGAGRVGAKVAAGVLRRGAGMAVAPCVETKKKARPKRDAPSNKIVWQLLVGLSL